MKRKRAIGEKNERACRKTSNEKKKWKWRLSHTSNGRAYEKSTDYIIAKCSLQKPMFYSAQRRNTHATHSPYDIITESTAFATKPIIDDYRDSHVILACASIRWERERDREREEEKKEDEEENGRKTVQVKRTSRGCERIWETLRFNECRNFAE